MRTYLMLTLLCLLCLSLPSGNNLWAQNANEWLRPKRTQRNYLITQIAALQLYGNALKRGYDTFQAGSGLIRDVKAGEFSLHNQQLQTLLGFSPRLSPLANATAFTTTYLSLSQQINRARQSLTGMSLKTSDHLVLVEVYAGMLEKVLANASQMEILLRNNAFQMNEAERVEAFVALEAELQDIREDLVALNNMLSFYAAYGSAIRRENQVIQNILNK
ncbi:hypothetical protein ACFOUP_12860 [Belliella kenyensis]|uniref:Type IV pili methyl-accepting chemotaxis transducer N-term n=1 Tax=Belliella kenyensis TaxID=1472724 RepID=A0ABV8ENV2_9BACT|nr:hypothetical protein [Belliella kenyensis]MCH7400864.1 hypothetical protein [Belliella kenyensis]MDN3601849.1 hypothetical protein [Belliella kenyensis]